MSPVMWVTPCVIFVEMPLVQLLEQFATCSTTNFLTLLTNQRATSRNKIKKLKWFSRGLTLAMPVRSPDDSLLTTSERRSETS